MGAAVFGGEYNRDAQKEKLLQLAAKMPEVVSTKTTGFRIGLPMLIGNPVENSIRR
jgi:hypothetical protein